MRKVQWQKEWYWWVGLVLLLSLHFWFPFRTPGPAHDTYSVSAEGKKAFYLLVKTQPEVEADRVRSSLVGYVENLQEHYRYEDLVCILGAERMLNEEEWQPVLNWVAQGGSLLVAARQDRPGFKIPQVGVEVRSTAIATDFPETVLARQDNLYWQTTAEVLAPATAESLVTVEGKLQAARLKHGRGRIVVAASDFIFSNQSMAWEEEGHGQTATLAYRLLETACPHLQTVHFDESLNITGAPKIVGLLFDPLLRPITVQLLIGLLLYGWWRSRRFGPVLPEAVSARQNIVDHTDTVGVMLFKTDNGRAALRSYLTYIIKELNLKMHRGKEERVLAPAAARLNREPAKLLEVLKRSSQIAKAKEVKRKTAAELIRRMAMILRAAKPAKSERARG